MSLCSLNLYSQLLSIDALPITRTEIRRLLQVSEDSSVTNVAFYFHA